MCDVQNASAVAWHPCACRRLLQAVYCQYVLQLLQLPLKTHVETVKSIAYVVKYKYNTAYEHQACTKTRLKPSNDATRGGEKEQQRRKKEKRRGNKKNRTEHCVNKRTLKWQRSWPGEAEMLLVSESTLSVQVLRNFYKIAVKEFYSIKYLQFQWEQWNGTRCSRKSI